MHIKIGRWFEVEAGYGLYAFVRYVGSFDWDPGFGITVSSWREHVAEEKWRPVNLEGLGD